MEHRPSVEMTAKAYETADANVRSLVWWGIGVFALLAGGVIVSAVVFHYFVAHQTLGPPASPFENVRALPPSPTLQVTPARDLRQYLDSQDTALNSYGWVDQKAGVVRIPIDHAMDLLLQKGLPFRSGAEGKKAAQKPASSSLGSGRGQ